MNAKESFGQKLRKLRMNRGLTQADISNQLGYSSPQFISNWERGLVGVPPKKLREVAKLLRVKPETLVNEMVADYRARISAEL